MQRGIRVGRIGGIDIGVHPSWIIAFGLISWSLAESYLPSIYARWSTSQYWFTGVVGALSLFISVLIHELSHSVVAKARGFEVHSIILFIFGGVSNIKGEARNPRDEFSISVVGPLTSFLLAGLFWAIRQVGVDSMLPQGVAVLDYLVMANILLGAFNLIPGFPLDGGRVLRSIVWAITGNGQTAVKVAAASGQVVGFLFMAFGIWQVFGGNLVGGVWIAFIGWFLTNAAETSAAQSLQQRRLEGLRVGDLMDHHIHVVPSGMFLADLVSEAILVHDARAFPVVDDEALVGLITLTDVRRVDRGQWAVTSVAQAMTPRLRLRTVQAGENMSHAFELLSSSDLNQVPVLDASGRLVGLLSRANVLAALQIRDELGIQRLGEQARAGQPVSSARASR
ncbi:MAG: site-2 protease family protein [Chloroflexota bacterium]